jgi:ArsR family transcriptional regulator, arsenate/arsenite/antimonite-responsive transcriptional repressor
VLREAGLITADRRGTWVYYRLVPAAMADLAGLFTPALQPAGAQ